MANQIDSVCRRCGHSYSDVIENNINVLCSPTLKDKICSGDYFRWTCPECGTENLLSFPLLYQDQSLIILLTNTELQSDGLPEGYTGRIVRTPGELIEKIKIFDSGLDDIVMEMCKLITLQELGKEVELKFFMVNGADSELTFTYPENGQMELLAVGLNVYEDCAGIVNRNPAIKKAAQGLVRVDQGWLANFFA